jgi:hypothetical protein
MYDYALSDSLRALLTASLNEIETFKAETPAEPNLSHFRVWSEVIARLWPESVKAQNLAFSIFDLLHGQAKKKDTFLSMLWVGSCIYAVAGLGALPLAEFIQRLALRMTGMLPDELNEILKLIFTSKVGVEKKFLLHADRLLMIKVNVLRAVKTSIPRLYPGLRELGIQNNPQIEALI